MVEPIIESMIFAGGKGDHPAAVIIVADGKRQSFQLSEQTLLFAIQSAVGAIRRRRDSSSDVLID